MNLQPPVTSSLFGPDNLLSTLSTEMQQQRTAGILRSYDTYGTGNGSDRRVMIKCEKGWGGCSVGGRG